VKERKEVWWVRGDRRQEFVVEVEHGRKATEGGGLRRQSVHNDVRELRRACNTGRAYVVQER
jgi:hypothetical protein